MKCRLWDGKEMSYLVLYQTTDYTKNLVFSSPRDLVHDVTYIDDYLGEVKDVYMFAIGRQDKNGKEIYVGDYVKYKGNSLYREVYFDEIHLQYRNKIVDNEAENAASYPLSFNLSVEVVGNKYENPDYTRNTGYNNLSPH